MSLDPPGCQAVIVAAKCMPFELKTIMLGRHQRDGGGGGLSPHLTPVLDDVRWPLSLFSLNSSLVQPGGGLEPVAGYNCVCFYRKPGPIVQPKPLTQLAMLSEGKESDSVQRPTVMTLCRAVVTPQN